MNAPKRIQIVFEIAFGYLQLRRFFGDKKSVFVVIFFTLIAFGIKFSHQISLFAFCARRGVWVRIFFCSTIIANCSVSGRGAHPGR